MIQTLFILLLLVGVGYSESYNMTNPELKEPQFDIGKTKSGAHCRIVATSGNGTCRPNAKGSNALEQFVMRQNGSAPIGTFSNAGYIKYDCFLDIDTEEFELFVHKMIEEDDKYVQVFGFQRRTKIGTCDVLQYIIGCEDADNSTVFCFFTQKCVECTPAGWTLLDVVRHLTCFIVSLILVYLFDQAIKLFL